MHVKWDGDGTPTGANAIVSTRIETEFVSMSKESGGRMQTDAAEVVKAMDSVQALDWGVPGGFCFTYDFLEWETFKTIFDELFENVGLCLVAVLVITTLLIGHPGELVKCCSFYVIDVIDLQY